MAIQIAGVVNRSIQLIQNLELLQFLTKRSHRLEMGGAVISMSIILSNIGFVTSKIAFALDAPCTC